MPPPRTSSCPTAASPNSFDAAFLRFDGGDDFLFNLDDLTRSEVPEPGGTPWQVIAAAGFVGAAARRRGRMR